MPGPDASASAATATPAVAAARANAARPAHSSPRLAALAGLLADETRARFCLTLLDGRAWTAGELARSAGVAASTASEHLSKLVHGGLLTEERHGRFRYVRLANPGAAHLVEELVSHAAPEAEAPRGLRAVRASAAMARGRTCYDHLAGRLGTTLTEALTERQLLDQRCGFALTGAGLRWFGDLGLDPRGARGRPVARGCLDWTERTLHLAGAAGAALCRHAFDAGWCERTGTERAVRVTDDGERALRDLLGIAPGILR
ncbi:ArsR/SmtB family transcription factor [Streptomyces sp. SBT349]|uniref:ArsR/SmtB family transcription factor n=1 Tax=Streptomyces sp. SBT349 TaxID=1580539 RepID=UPI00099C50FA|nr:helix-turn-helix domain-containing protein [Streptomyces sp. SBT349]